MCIVLPCVANEFYDQFPVICVVCNAKNVRMHAYAGVHISIVQFSAASLTVPVVHVQFAVCKMPTEPCLGSGKLFSFDTNSVLLLKNPIHLCFKQKLSPAS